MIGGLAAAGQWKPADTEQQHHLLEYTVRLVFELLQELIAQQAGSFWAAGVLGSQGVFGGFGGAAHRNPASFLKSEFPFHLRLWLLGFADACRGMGSVFRLEKAHASFGDRSGRVDVAGPVLWHSESAPWAV